MPEEEACLALKRRLVEEAERRWREPPPGLVPFTGVPEADALVNDLEDHPHAFVLACLMDRQVQAGRAWSIPFELRRRLGFFDLEGLARLTEADFVEALERPVPLHRFNREMGRTLHEAVRRILDVYGGDAARIWVGRPPSAAVVRRFLEFRGAGPRSPPWR